MGLKRYLRNQQRENNHVARRKAGSHRVPIDCPRCHGKVGIPVDLYMNGVQSDPDKRLVTLGVRKGVSMIEESIESSLQFFSTPVGNERVNPLHFICEKCGYREGVTKFGYR